MYNDRPTRLQRWLHRKGISRRLGATHAGGVGWIETRIETALPFIWLARVSARWDTPTLRLRRRVDRWCWRWTFVR